MHGRRQPPAQGRSRRGDARGPCCGAPGDQREVDTPSCVRPQRTGSKKHWISSHSAPRAGTLAPGPRGHPTSRHQTGAGCCRYALQLAVSCDLLLPFIYNTPGMKSMAQRKAVLITGGSGYLGQHLIHALHNQFKVGCAAAVPSQTSRPWRHRLTRCRPAGAVHVQQGAAEARAGGCRRLQGSCEAPGFASLPPRRGMSDAGPSAARSTSRAARGWRRS